MLNYNKILKNLSPENFQKKKEEFNIKLDDLNIKEVSDILNKLDSNLLTESDFTKTKTLMDCLKYLSKKSSVYSMAKDLIINRIEMIEKTLSEHDVQFLSEIFPKNLKESLNNLNKSEERLKKLYLEKITMICGKIYLMKH